MPFLAETDVNNLATNTEATGVYDDPTTVAAVKGLSHYMDGDNNVQQRNLPQGYRSRVNPLFEVVFNDIDGSMLTDEQFAQNRHEYEPTLDNLLRDSNVVQQSYDLSDFLYARDADICSGYHMLTLRRFPNAVDDCISWPNNSKMPQTDIGRLVTYTTEEINKISSIMNMSFGLRWKEQTADFWTPEVIGSPWGADGLVGQMFKLMNPSYLATKDAFQNSFNVDPQHDQNKVYGPVDSIVQTHIRDRGLSFDQNISLEFNYELRSYDGLNGKAVFIDLLAHVLSVTFNDAKFWGGAIKWVGIPQSAHHKYMSAGTAKSMNGDFEANVNYYKTQLSSLAGSNTAETILNAAKMLLNGLGAFAFDKIVKVLGRQTVVVANSLLSGESVGPWHLTVGNPFRPIATIGNLILNNTTITLGDEIGHDGFPTSMKVVCELKHAKPRSRAEIEMMFNYGQKRLFFQPEMERLKKNLNHSRAYRNKKPMLIDNLTNELYTFLDSKANVSYDKLAQSAKDNDYFKFRNSK